MRKTDSPLPPGEPARWQSSPHTTQKRKCQPLPSSPTPGHHILVLPQKCNGSDPVLHWPSTGCHMMLSQRNMPIVLCGKHSAEWCVYRFLLFEWVNASMGTTHGARVTGKEVFVATLSVVGRSMLSSEKLFTERLRCHAPVSYPHKYCMS